MPGNQRRIFLLTWSQNTWNGGITTAVTAIKCIAPSSCVAPVTHLFHLLIYLIALVPSKGLQCAKVNNVSDDVPFTVKSHLQYNPKGDHPISCLDIGRVGLGFR
jgi:hypothetical protein